MGFGRRTDFKFRKDRSFFNNFVIQFFVFTRINLINAATQDGDGIPPCRQGSAVGNAINATRKTTDDGATLFCKSSRKPFCHGLSVRACSPGTDDSNGIRRTGFSPDTLYIEKGRGIINRRKQGWIGGIIKGEQCGTDFCQTIQLTVNRIKSFERDNFFSDSLR